MAARMFSPSSRTGMGVSLTPRRWASSVDSLINNVLPLDSVCYAVSCVPDPVIETVHVSAQGGPPDVRVSVTGPHPPVSHDRVPKSLLTPREIRDQLADTGWDLVVLQQDLH